MTFSFRSVAHFVAIVVLMFFCELFSSSTYASTNSGIDTPAGVTTLPLAVQGVEGMDLVAQPSGAVYLGIGITNPEAALDISGAVRATGSTVVSGTAYPTVKGQSCTPEGATAYDMTNHVPVYCSQAPSVWTSVQSSFTPMWTAISWPANTTISVNLANYVPATATAVQLTMGLATYAMGGAVTEGYLDSNLVCFGQFGGIVGGINSFAFCSNSITTSPGTHILKNALTGGCNVGVCYLAVSGYFQ